jgi:cytochrome P450
LANIGIQLVPKWVGDANKEIEDWALNMCDAAASFLARTHATRVEDVATDDAINFPVVYAQMQLAMAKGQKNDQARDSQPERLEMASEMLDHLAAGFDTSGITLTYVIHELSQRPESQAALRKELLTLGPPLSLDQIQEKTESLPSAKSLDALPLLDAIVQETLRLRSAIPGPEPRITPPGGCRLGLEGEYAKIPGGVRISAQAYSLHRNPKVYEKPDEWDPHRWLQASEDKIKEMRKWFWAFGSGGRMCVGSNLALYGTSVLLCYVD